MDLYRGREILNIKFKTTILQNVEVIYLFYILRGAEHSELLMKQKILLAKTQKNVKC